MAEGNNIFERIDAAVLLAAAMDYKNEPPLSMGWDRPSHASGVYLALIHTYPVIREKFLGSSFMMMKRETKEELVKASIKKLVRKGLLVGYSVPMPVMNSVTKVLKTMKARRYRPLSVLEAMARL